MKVSYQHSPYPEKIMIKKMNCKISRSQPTTKRTKKVHNIKIATTKRAKDQINGQKNSRCQDRTTKRTKDQINGQKVQDVNEIALLNGPKIK